MGFTGFYSVFIALYWFLLSSTGFYCCFFRFSLLWNWFSPQCRASKLYPVVPRVCCIFGGVSKRKSSLIFLLEPCRVVVAAVAAAVAVLVIAAAELDGPVLFFLQSFFPSSRRTGSAGALTLIGSHTRVVSRGRGFSWPRIMHVHLIGRWFRQRALE